MPRAYVTRTRKDPAERPALARGIPEKFVECLLDVLGVDEDAITVDARLMEDLGSDSLDIVELGMHCEVLFKLPDGAVDEEMTERWGTGTVGSVLADLRTLGAHV
jgi:acyl carrier protein